MKLQTLYREVVKKGITSDVRSKKEIDDVLKKNKEAYEAFDKKRKEFFDTDSLFNPFADTRVLNGDTNRDIKSLIVGVDVEGPELLLVDRLREKGTAIDLVVAHHPEGRAYANFYDVMDLQVDMFTRAGVSVSAAENLLYERKAQIGRRLNAVNHERSVDVARYLGINFMCMHTPADNLAYRHIEQLVKKEKPQTLGQVMDLLYTIPEYRAAAADNNPPLLALGSKKSRVSKIHIEFTGGTEGPKGIYEKLAASGVDTIICMHQSEEHYKQCKEAHINVVFASHIASDTVGINCMLDYLQTKEKIKVYTFSGVKRFERKGKR